MSTKTGKFLKCGFEHAEGDRQLQEQTETQASGQTKS